MLPCKCSIGGIPRDKISPDYELFTSLIERMILYETKKYELYKLHSERYTNSEESINIINNELNEQFTH